MPPSARAHGPWFLRGWTLRPSRHAHYGFGRVGGLIDGIFAITATLLVLDLRVPDHAAGHLGHALSGEGKAYAAYAIGFTAVLAGWTQTRRLDAWLKGVDHWFTILLLLQVAGFSLLPFTTHALAAGFSNRADLAAAVRLSGIVLTISMVLWALALLYARHRRLFRDGIDPEAFVFWFRASMLIWLMPLAAFALAYLSAAAGLIVLVAYFLVVLVPVEDRSPAAA